eukprot:TRINITY_DN13267_c0_g1_i3.p1 TRINITY_DN13267_c0_g1~~TRINITY_DN13267_c0_g1_i3.p1  ORF type:complete len:262 (+),score=51.62 TRINITY_DN13267_c0_g1_i3:194-979(+)
MAAVVPKCAPSVLAALTVRRGPLKSTKPEEEDDNETPVGNAVEIKEQTVAPPSTAPAYADGRLYWNQRYAEDLRRFEWLEGYEQLCDIIVRISGKGARCDCQILHVGCGNSPLAEDMYDDGYTDIVNVDTAEVVIQQMSENNSTDRPLMRWVVGDVTNMSAFPSEGFDIVLDKSLLDTFTCSVDAKSIIDAYFAEVQRLLRPGGNFLCVSFGAPSSRLKFFEGLPHFEFTFWQEKLPRRSTTGATHFAYVWEKLAREESRN